MGNSEILLIMLMIPVYFDCFIVANLMWWFRCVSFSALLGLAMTFNHARLSLLWVSAFQPAAGQRLSTTLDTGWWKTRASSQCRHTGTRWQRAKDWCNRLITHSECYYTSNRSSTLFDILYTRRYISEFCFMRDSKIYSTAQWNWNTFKMSRWTIMLGVVPQQRDIHTPVFHINKPGASGWQAAHLHGLKWWHDR